MNSKPTPLGVKTWFAVAVVALLSGSAQADILWQGPASGRASFNLPADWVGGVVPGGAGVNADNNNGSSSIITIGPSDPVWTHGDQRMGDTDNSSGTVIQTGSTNIIGTVGGSWFREGDSTGSAGYYWLSNGVMQVGGDTHVGEVGYGYFEIDGGILNLPSPGGIFAMAYSDQSGGTPTGVVVINGGTINSSNQVWIGEGDGAGTAKQGTGYFIMNGGILNCTNGFLVGRSDGIGTMNMTNGTVNQRLNQFQIASIGTGHSVGTLNLAGGAINIYTPAGSFDIADGTSAQGTLNQSGGTLTCEPGGDVEYWIGNNGFATNNLSGGQMIWNNWGAIGRGGNGPSIGVLNLSAGTITKQGANDISIASFAAGTGIINQTGGSINETAGNVRLGEGGVGIWNMNGGTNTLGGVTNAFNASATGTLNLNGGTMAVACMAGGEGTSYLNFNGGILQALGNSLDFVNNFSSAMIDSGGAVIDAQSYAVTIAQDLGDGGGGLTKLGTGTLTLSGNNYYSGATTVSGGTLMLAAPTTFNSPLCTVSNGAAFGVMPTTAKAQVIVSALSLAAGGTGLTFNFSGLGGQSVAPLYVTSLAVNGPVTINVAGYDFSPGQFPLVQYNTWTGSGGFNLGSLPSGMVAQLVTNVSNQSIDLLVTAATADLPWQIKPGPLMTDWAQQVIPTNVLPEYPRPQMVRSNWMNLNGVWQFQAGATNDAVPTGQNLAGTILVPFPMESALSGVMQYSEFSWYRRTFTLPSGWAGQRIILHLDAVNWQSQVYVNGQSVGAHTGGYDPFSYDITPYLTGTGPQELIVQVYSPEDTHSEPRGKQTLYPGGIMYTSSSGIWQPAWLEPVPATSIGTIHLVPDIDHNRLLVTVAVNGPTNNINVNAVAFAGTNQVASTTSAPGTNFYLNLSSPTLWCPTNPYLYNLRISLTTNSTTLDSVASYFGMRKISLATNNGFIKMYLNNQFTFEFGPLDQGFWPDGIYTAPTDLALKSDIEMDKALGFNLIRKHIKVERQRWYYWADTLGILVWQDMPSCNSYTGSSSPPAVDPLDYIAELTSMVTNHWNSPSVIMWDIFNEGQGEVGSADGAGQTNTAYLVSLVKTLDPSRLVNQASGGNYFGVGDVLDEHSYTPPGVPTSSYQAVVCGEFGGVSLYVPNHTWSATETGEGSASNSVDLLNQFDGFCGLLSGFILNNGMSAAVYTQISDVETELNGLKTYDRKVLKPSLAGMQMAINSLMTQYSNSVVIPSSQTTPQKWQYTTNSPGANWYATNFDASSWSNGLAGLGTADPNVTPNTPWTTQGYIYLRRTFNPGALTPQQISNLVFNVYHDEAVTIYVNGVLAASASGYTTTYVTLPMNAQAQAAIIPNGTNVLAVSCDQTTGGQFIDVGINSLIEVAPPPPIFVPNWLENGTGLTAQYFNGTNLANFLFVRTDTNVDFNGFPASPGSGLANSNFSVSWVGKIQPRYSEGYTFHLTASDGCQLYVNGQLLINKWHDDTNTDATGSISLIGGQQYSVVINYYDHTNPPDVILEWESASQARQVVPQGVLFPATPPTVAPINNATLTAGQILTVANSATDTNFPGQTFTWSLGAAPVGASINAFSGLLIWRPAISQSPSTNQATVIVTDNGTPYLSATQSFRAVVLPPLPPALLAPAITNGKFHVSIAGSVGPDYSIYAATNLISGWQLLLDTNPTTLPFEFAELVATNFPQRFYRVLLGP